MWLLGFYDSTRDKDDTTVGVGHSRRYCNTGYDQSQGQRPSTLKCTGPISKGDIEANHLSEINPNSDSRSRSDGRSRRFVQYRVDQSLLPIPSLPLMFQWESQLRCSAGTRIVTLKCVKYRRFKDGRFKDDGNFHAKGYRIYSERTCRNTEIREIPGGRSWEGDPGRDIPGDPIKYGRSGNPSLNALVRMYLTQVTFSERMTPFQHSCINIMCHLCLYKLLKPYINNLYNVQCPYTVK